MLCMEQDLVWGASSIALVQAPMMLGGGTFMTMTLTWQSNFIIENFGSNLLCVMTFGTLFFQFIPYPLVILSVQLLYLLKPKKKLTGYSNVLDILMMLISLEAAGEAGPQSLLQLYIILSDHERELQWVTILTLVSSLFTIAKASIPAFTSREGNNNLLLEVKLSNGEPSVLVGFYTSTLRFVPVFVTSILFRVTSASITLVLLKRLGFIPLGVGIASIFIISFIRNKKRKQTLFRSIVGSLQHGIGGLTVLTKSFLGSRDDNKLFMMMSSVIWLVIHFITFLVIIFLVMTPHYRLKHWKNTARIPLLAEDSLYILYLVMGTLILIGIFNVFLVWLQIYNVDWGKVNRNVKKRMRWIRGEVAGQMPEIGYVEPYLRTIERKLLACWKFEIGKTSENSKNVAFPEVEPLRYCPIRDWNVAEEESVGLKEIKENDNANTSQRFKFVAVTRSEGIPTSAFPLKVCEQKILYVGRALHEGLYVPGYVLPRENYILISSGLRGLEKEGYEVLVQEPGQHNLYWVDSNKGSLEDIGAVGVGATANGDNMYVGRAKVDGMWLAGKINQRYKACFIVDYRNGMWVNSGDSLRKIGSQTFVWTELMVNDYQVLCARIGVDGEGVSGPELKTH